MAAKAEAFRKGTVRADPQACGGLVGTAARGDLGRAESGTEARQASRWEAERGREASASWDPS